MATPFVAGNWKMNTTVSEAAKLARELRASLRGVDGVTQVVCPPFVALSAVATELNGSAIAVGAQNMHPEARGAFTGEISGEMLRDHCFYVILGHSERRHLLGELDVFINAKLHAAIKAGLTPILCVGETLDERDAGQAEEVVGRQLMGGLDELTPEQVGRCVIAYEPVWAIGTGRAATPEQAQEMMAFIRHGVAELTGTAEAGEVPLLYGGSVNPANADELASQQEIDGALVGGASLKPADFTVIVTAFATRTSG